MSLLLISAITYGDEAYLPKQGDIIFQSLPHSALVDAIEGATNSKYSHVGIVLNKNNEWYVREAIGPVIDTPIEQFKDRGRGQHIDVYRLKAQFQKHVARFVQESGKYIGRPYDIRYQMDDENIYCSELVYKSYQHATGDKLAKLVTLGSLAWGDYALIIKDIEGGYVPKNRMMITPKDLSESEYLELVYVSSTNNKRHPQ